MRRGGLLWGWGWCLSHPEYSHDSPGWGDKEDFGCHLTEATRHSALTRGKRCFSSRLGKGLLQYNCTNHPPLGAHTVSQDLPRML